MEHTRTFKNVIKKFLGYKRWNPRCEDFAKWLTEHSEESLNDLEVLWNNGYHPRAAYTLQSHWRKNRLKTRMVVRKEEPK